MIELLVVKSGKDYYHFKKEQGEPCSLQRASVFSLAQVKEIRQLCKKLRSSGTLANIVKLTILEEPFSELRND